jgi:hypothetical protein
VSSTPAICEYVTAKGIKGINQRIISIGQQVAVHIEHSPNGCAGHKFSDSLTVQTGNGWHRVYALDGLRPATLKLATGIDGRTGPMYLVAPDSLHWSGVRYILTVGAAIAPLDMWAWLYLGMKGEDQERDESPPREEPELDAEEIIAKYEQARPRIRELFETIPDDGKWSDALRLLSLELVDAGASRPERFCVLKAGRCRRLRTG